MTGLSPFALLRAFRAATGVPPGAYRRERLPAGPTGARVLAAASRVSHEH